MKQLQKLLNLAQRDRWLIIRTLLLLGTIRLGLKLLPFQTLRRLFKKISQPREKLQEIDKTFVNKVSWAVKRVSRYIPGTQCLAQALATQVLLEQQNYPTQLCIGFARSEHGQISAHAWVECKEQVVIGGTRNMNRYITVPIQELGDTNERRWYLLS